MGLRLPSHEMHYLTAEGDVVDLLCWQYYGITQVATEAVYRRNPFLSREDPVLPAMRLIVLPILSDERIVAKNQLWNYKTRTIFDPTAASKKKAVATKGQGFEGCCANNVPAVDDADWLAVYIKNEVGDFVLRRMPKANLRVICDCNGSTPGYGFIEGTDPSLLL